MPQVTSPYSGKGLPFVINEKGEVFVDYRIDLYDALKKMKGSLQREKIFEIYFRKVPSFVPAYSLPYTVKDGEPIF